MLNAKRVLSMASYIYDVSKIIVFKIINHKDASQIIHWSYKIFYIKTIFKNIYLHSYVKLNMN